MYHNGNPFNPGSGSMPPFLAGRDHEITMFKKMLDTATVGGNTNMLLTGLRGTGKTVLLNEFSKICREKKFFPIKRLQFSHKHNEAKEFYSVLKYDISTSVSDMSVAKKITQRIKSAGSQMRPKSVDIPELFYYEPSYTSESIPFENHLENYLSNNWNIFRDRGYKGVMFLFDEFHVMHDNTESKFHVLGDFIGAINELQNKGFPYCLVLAGLPKLPLNVKKARSYAERMFKTAVLTNLPREDALMAISKPLKDSPYSFDKKLLDAVVSDTGQYPYFIQFYCKEIIDSVSKKKISLRDYESVKSVIVRQLEVGFFDPRVDALTETDKEVLISMARADMDDIEFNDVVAGSSVRKGSIPKYLQRLESGGLVYRHKHGIYRFSLPMLRDYIVRKYGR